MMLVLGLLAATIQGGGDRPTIVAKASEPPRRNFAVVYYDEGYLFAVRHYGDSRDPSGNTEPGLFVHSKEKNAWIQITSISTAEGRFGKSTSEDPEAKRKLRVAPVMWDFTRLAQHEYADQPLRTSASIVFPDRIRYDSGSGRYELGYLTSWDVTSAETVLFIRRQDLVQAFAQRQ